MDLNCNEVFEHLADYLDEDARLELCRAMEAHLVRCRDCRVYVDTVKKTIVLYQNNVEVPMPARVSEQLALALSREYETRDGTGR